MRSEALNYFRSTMLLLTPLYQLTVTDCQNVGLIRPPMLVKTVKVILLECIASSYSIIAVSKNRTPPEVLTLHIAA